MQTQSLEWLTDPLVFVNVDITCWSGKKNLTPEDLGLDRAQLPPETLVSLGDKQLIDPEALRAFTSIRSAARRLCLAVGCRFMGGYAVPAAKAPALLTELDGLRQRYQTARAAFLAGYDGQLAAWIQQQPPEWQKLIQDALVPAEYVGGRLSFAVQAVRFSAPDPAVVAHGGLQEALSGLSDQVFHEVAQLAREALEKSFQGKEAVTRRALSPLVSIRDKLDGLAFMNTRFRAVVGEINRLMGQVPTQGPIANGVLATLCQFLSLAAQPAGLQTWAANAAVWQAPQDLLLWSPEAAVVASAEDAVVPAFVEDAAIADAEITASVEDAAIVASVVASAEDASTVSKTEPEPPVTPATEAATEVWFF